MGAQAVIRGEGTPPWRSRSDGTWYRYFGTIFEKVPSVPVTILKNYRSTFLLVTAHLWLQAAAIKIKTPKQSSYFANFTLFKLSPEFSQTDY